MSADWTPAIEAKAGEETLQEMKQSDLVGKGRQFVGKCQYLKIPYKPKDRIWLEAYEHPEKKIKDDHLTPKYSDFVTIIARDNIIVARPIHKLGDHGDGRCSEECENQIIKICEEALEHLSWEETNKEETDEEKTNAILFRIFTPYKYNEEIYPTQRQRDIEAGLERDLATDHRLYMFPQHVNMYKSIIEAKFEKIFGIQWDKVFQITGYHAFRSEESMVNNARIILADIDTAKLNRLVTDQGEYHLKPDMHGDIKAGYPLVITSGPGDMTPGAVPALRARLCRGFLGRPQWEALRPPPRLD